MQHETQTQESAIGRAPRKVRRWTAVLFVLEVVVVVALVTFSWVSGSWT
ncbi:hypothetical protein [Sanguibacter antarcticus]|uniref:Uncharacterized protein n=1 Tax=Sanguibacter antarcticus TaxID=372484 RepID=A0A2A9E8C5_9MICO|nr:hypothetical protein [Sanguibacter antarcticus]PFG34482.1 hypothetical protein ATL42_2392 [Sanguibacter antarcticus]